MDSSKLWYAPTIAEMTVAEPAERQLALLLKAERLFDTQITKAREDSSKLFLCVMLQDVGNNYDDVAEPGLMLRMLRATCSIEENYGFKTAPFGILAKEKGVERYKELNLHRAFWLDFMILVLADEAGVELVDDESLSEEVPGVPAVPKDMTVPKGLS